jgi:tRNA(His) 5'-end guanylyltransferase
MNNDNLGDRMKEYEAIPSNKLISKIPVLIRIDGRAFHSVTKHFTKPFDQVLIKTMQETTKELCENISDCRIGYTQSDEISLLIYPKDIWTSELFFGGKVQKICSITASMATMFFYKNFIKNVKEFQDFVSKEEKPESKKLLDTYNKIIEKGINFDSRCFNIPIEEVENYFIWRQQDATKNSIQMVARTLYSHKELEGKKFADLNELLFQKDVNFDKLPTVWKRGTAVIKIPQSIQVEGQSNPVIRNKWWVDNDMPIITEHRDYITNNFKN